SSAPHSKPPRISPSSANSFVARQVCDSPCAVLSKSSADDSGISEPIENTPIPLLVRGSATLPPLAPPKPFGEGGGMKTASWTPAMRACEGPLKSASRIATRRPRARSAPARCRVNVLLPTPPLPDPMATRWRTPASPSAMRARCSATCSRILDPPSPTMSWYDFTVRAPAYTDLLGPRSGRVEAIPTSGAETECLQAFCRKLRRVDFLEPEGPPAQPGQQVLHTGPSVFDQRAERYDFPILIYKVGLDALGGGDRDACEAVLPCRQGLDRPLPARPRIGLEEPVGSQVVDGHGNHEPAVIQSHRLRRAGLCSIQHIVGQQRFLNV